MDVIKKFGYYSAEMMATYFRSDLIRILIVVLGLGFAIPFIAMQLSLAGVLLSIVTDNIIGSGSSLLLVQLL